MLRVKKLLTVAVALVLSAAFAGATAPYAPHSVHDGQCYTIDGHIPAPSSFCGVSIVEAKVEQVWSGSSRSRAGTTSALDSANDVILGSAEQESEGPQSDDPQEIRAIAAKRTVLDLPNGDHLWAAIEYVWTSSGLFLPYDCELESALVSASEINNVVDRMRIAAGGAIELLPRNVSLGEDYVAVAVDGNSDVMLAVDAGSWRTSLVMFSCGRS
jgi:hypothetical protein